MPQNSTVGVYGNLGEAQAAVRSLGSKFPFALLGGAEEGIAGPTPYVTAWLFNLGLNKEAVSNCEGALKAGKLLVIVHGSVNAAKGAHDVLAGSKAEHLKLHALAIT